MNLNRIGIKLGATIIALFLVVLVALGYVIDQLFTSFYHAKMQEDVEELAIHFEKMVHSNEIESDSMIRDFAEFSEVQVYWVDVRTQRVEGRDSVLQNGAFIEPSDFISLSLGEAIFKEFTAEDQEHFFVAARPIESQQRAFYVVSSMAQMEQSLKRVRHLLLLSGSGAFFLALGFTFIVTKVLSRPLIQMEQATRRIARGELETRLQIQSSDEMGSLAKAINDLAKELQHYRDTRQEFFANISHELRTPITYLEGYAKVLKDELYDTEEEKNQYLTIISQESMRLNRMIHDLFELSKMEEGKVELNPAWIDLHEVASDCLQKVQLKAKEKGLDVRSDLQHPVSLIYADRLRMEQVLLNLLENAIRYTEQGHIALRLVQENYLLKFVVEDTGIGIPESELPYLFERFYRVEKSRARMYGGSGLGLAIVKMYVELQGGSVYAERRRESGTRFVVEMPLETN